MGQVNIWCINDPGTIQEFMDSWSFLWDRIEASV
jgi:hypothetical protein